MDVFSDCSTRVVHSVTNQWSQLSSIQKVPNLKSATVDGSDDESLVEENETK